MYVVTIADLEKMTPAERKAHFEASIVWRVEDVPEQHRDVLEAQRRRVLDREARLRKNAS